MQIAELEAFLAVAEAASFSRAAEQLHLSQPAVSKRISSLERHLEATLFDRVGKRIYLTDAGNLLRPRAESLLTGIADTRRLLQNQHERIDGPLSLATSHHVGLHRLAPILKTFSRTHAAVSLDIRFEDSEAAHDLVRRASSELAVVTLNPQGDSELFYEPLWDDPLCFIVAADHELAGCEGIDLDSLAQYPVILPGLGTYTGRIVAATFEARNVPLRPALSTNFLETIAMLVGIGLGWSVLPASMVGEGLVRLSTDAPDLHRTLGCVLNPRRTLSNAARAFVEVLLSSKDPAAQLAHDSA
ncbi:MAG: LysR family transcriptional regulator [Gammaproteobacteria bacterium]|nr:LysR family transcriptional regulator [Gammaproteobacteria bacterium]